MKELKIKNKMFISLPEFCSELEIILNDKVGNFFCYLNVYDDGFYSLKNKSFIREIINPIQIKNNYVSIKIPSGLFNFKHKGKIKEDLLIINDKIWNTIYSFIKNNLYINPKFEIFTIDNNISLIFKEIVSDKLWCSGYVLGNCYLSIDKSSRIKFEKKIETNSIFSEQYDLYQIPCPKIFFQRYPYERKNCGFNEKDWNYIEQYIRKAR